MGLFADEIGNPGCDGVWRRLLGELALDRPANRESADREEAYSAIATIFDCHGCESLTSLIARALSWCVVGTMSSSGKGGRSRPYSSNGSR